jgi:hypothetical protein
MQDLRRVGFVPGSIGGDAAPRRIREARPPGAMARATAAWARASASAAFSYRF